MLLEQMKTIKERVEYLLIKYAHLRENDYKLIASYFYYVLGKDRLENMTAIDFLKMFADGKLPHTESIRRDRQKLQEEKPELRGENYGKRKKAGEITTKEIKDL